MPRRAFPPEYGLTPASSQGYHPLRAMPRTSVTSCLLRSSLTALLVSISLPAMSAQQPGAQTKPGMPRAERHESRHEIDLLEEHWKDAVIHHNVQVMESLLADDFIAITWNGTIQSKDQTLQNMKSGAMKITAIDFADRKVRFYGQTAVVTSRAEVSGGGVDGSLAGSFRYTRVYVRDGKGGWKIVSFEASRIQEPGEHR
jgi:ketosteroid isomerase-like protein